MSNGSPITTKVTITAAGISIDTDPIRVPRGPTGSPPPVVPIIWKVDRATSDPGAAITGITFPWPVPPAKGAGPYTQWPGSNGKATGGSGDWMVNDKNDNNTPKVTLKYAYTISGAINGSPVPDLDPEIDNQPPSP